MAHMLAMTASQVSHPIALLILMKPNDWLFHDDLIPSRLTIGLLPMTAAEWTTPWHSQHVVGFENDFPTFDHHPELA